MNGSTGGWYRHFTFSSSHLGVNRCFFFLRRFQSSASLQVSTCFVGHLWSKKGPNISSARTLFLQVADQPITIGYFCLFRLVKSSYGSSVSFSSLLSSVGSMELISTRLSAAFVSNTQAGEWERESAMEGPIFPSRRVSHSSLEGGSLRSPLSFFGQEQREYVGTNASGSVWLVWLEDAEETGSLQPTESMCQQKTSPH